MADINVTKIKEYLANIAQERNRIVLDSSIDDDSRQTKLSILDKENDELLQTFELYKLLLDDVSDVTFNNIESKIDNIIASNSSKLNNLFSSPVVANDVHFYPFFDSSFTSASGKDVLISFGKQSSTYLNFDFLHSGINSVPLSLNFSFYLFNNSFYNLKFYSKNDFSYHFYTLIDSDDNLYILFKIDSYFSSASLLNLILSVNKVNNISLEYVDSIDVASSSYTVLNEYSK